MKIKLKERQSTMACGKSLLYSFIFMVTLCFVLGEGLGVDHRFAPLHFLQPTRPSNSPNKDEESSARASGPFSFASLPGLETLSSLLSSNSNDAQMLNMPSFPFSSIFSGREANADSVSDSNENDNDSDGNDDRPQGRFFFSSLFPIRDVSCNFTTQAGSTCLKCRQAMRCSFNNVGRLMDCKIFFPYCNNGHCSQFPGPACFITSSTTTTTAATTIAAATAAATTAGATIAPDATTAAATTAAATLAPDVTTAAAG